MGKKGSDYYYLNSDGTYKTGWIETKDGDYYYCLKSGKMAKSCSVTINGVTYKFGKDGKALNKPTESKTTTNSSSKNKDNKTANKNEIVATKNQNTFPALVTYGVYCGMSKSDFKALKNMKILNGMMITKLILSEIRTMSPLRMAEYLQF